MKAVFDLNSGSRYADEIDRYHFEATGGQREYLDVALSALEDWVIYREARRNGGRQSYVAVARVVRVEPDPNRDGFYYAFVEDYLPFPTLVALAPRGRYAEAALRNVDRRLVGRTLQGHSLRPISDDDFANIVEAGLAETLAPENAVRIGLPPAEIARRFAGHERDQAYGGMAEDRDRNLERILTSRLVREANFRLQVCDAYDNRCAVTRMQILNGGGRAEVQAAHIVPVAEGGPDVVQNGIALSATVHWLFDRHLITVGEDYRLIVSHNRVPAELRNLFPRENEQILLPKNRALAPAQRFLAHHREKYVGRQ